jgi:hypothetical protein
MAAKTSSCVRNEDKWDKQIRQPSKDELSRSSFVGVLNTPGARRPSEVRVDAIQSRIQPLLRLATVRWFSALFRCRIILMERQPQPTAETALATSLLSLC